MKEPRIRFNKKMLVVSSFALPAPGASPHFLYNLFSQFSEDSYAIFTDSKNMNPEFTHPKLPCQYFLFDEKTNAIRWFKKDSPWKVVRVAKKMASFFSALRKGRKIIRREKIDLLMGTADNGRALLLAFLLSRISGTPYTLYFLDLYRWNNFGGLQDAAAAIFEPMLFSGAKKIFVMGGGHERLYRKKYGTRYCYEIITNCPIVSETAPTKKPRPTVPKSYFEILYTGNIYWPQERSIRNVIKAVSSMDDLDVRVSIYAPRPLEALQAEFAHNPKVSFRSAPQKDMPEIQANADILFLPLSWNTPRTEVVEMAIPGKTAEYLSSGKPILVHAPPRAYLSIYAHENNFAHVIDEEDIGLLQEGIRKLLTDKERVRQIVENARKTLDRDFDIYKNARSMKDALDKIDFQR